MTDASGPAFRRSLSTVDLTMIGFGSIFGSGWLFAASRVATIAGPGSIVAWMVAGLAVLLLGLVYCELGAALPQAGAMVRFPEWSHGCVPGFVMSVVTTIAFSSLIAIEVVAARQYAGAWLPGLTRDAAGDPTLAGWCTQAAILAALFGLNRARVTVFASVNNVVTLIKFCVPALVAVCLLAHARTANFTSHGTMVGGLAGMEAAISTGGIIFAYLGLTPIVAAAREAAHPQRGVPVALLTSVLLSMLVYVVLQAAFIGALPPGDLAAGWHMLDSRMTLPYHDLALALGFAWLGTLVVADATTPLGTANIYMNATARLIYAAAITGSAPARFSRLHAGSGTPRAALAETFALSLFWTMPFPSWNALIGVVSAALMMSYALAPPAAAALRRSAPQLARPFRLPCLEVAAAAAFVVASLIVFWTGWTILRLLLGAQLFAALGFAAVRRSAPDAALRYWLWLPVWLAGMMLISWSADGQAGVTAKATTGSIETSVFALLIHLWASRCGRPHDENLISMREDVRVGSSKDSGF